MIIQALVLIAIALTAPARADVSDSGNLTIGGQGIIQGTMTVQGNAFSVGGTTFSVSGGSVTLGGRLNAAAAGIKWADGTTSITASNGNVVLTATQTFSGAITFASSVTIGYTGVISATANYNSVLVGGESLVAFSTWTGATGVYFYNLVSTVVYHAVYCQKVVAQSNTGIQFNGDTGNNYHAYGQCHDASANSIQLGGNYGQAYLNEVTRGTIAGDVICGEFLFTTDPGLPKIVRSISARSNYAAGSSARECSTGFVYSGSSVLTNMRFQYNANVTTGWFELYARLIPQTTR